VSKRQAREEFRQMIAGAVRSAGRS
jgi:hypothetical protein